METIEYYSSKLTCIFFLSLTGSRNGSRDIQWSRSLWISSAGRHTSGVNGRDCTFPEVPFPAVETIHFDFLRTEINAVTLKGQGPSCSYKR